MNGLSILIPTFNNLNKLERCLNSLESLDKSIFEIIVWDDGSTDETQSYLKNQMIANMYSSNEGVSAARNKLIEVATKNYIMFLDSDDYLDADKLVEVFEEFCTTNLDYCRFGRQVIFNDGIKNETPSSIIKQVNDINVEYIDFYQRGYVKNVTSGIFKKSIIENHKIRFDESIKYAEDTIFAIMYLKYINGIFSSNKIVYYYDKRNEASSTNEYNIEMINSVYNILKAEKQYITNIENSTNIILLKYRRMLSILGYLYPEIDFPRFKRELVRFKKETKQYKIRLHKAMTFQLFILGIIYKLNASRIALYIAKKSGGY